MGVGCINYTRVNNNIFFNDIKLSRDTQITADELRLEIFQANIKKPILWCDINHHRTLYVVLEITILKDTHNNDYGDNPYNTTYTQIGFVVFKMNINNKHAHLVQCSVFGANPTIEQVSIAIAKSAKNTIPKLDLSTIDG
uniref:Uncharacterized protein n=1 Tax=Megaviridae environmental sample TaxID=1737588 RepID=A0A5J6VHY8_9VIRU|nr:MAG: hypothetical protein [Megaviridae environmental sample]